MLKALRRLRNRIAHWLWFRWPIHRDMPRWSYRFSLWISPWAVEWVYRDGEDV
jgi:hypothetical protein